MSIHGSSESAASPDFYHPLVLKKLQRPGLYGAEAPDLRPTRRVPPSYVGKMNEQKTRSSNRIVADLPARNHREAGLLNSLQDFAPEHHVVVAGNQAVNPALGKFGDELVVLIGPEQTWVNLGQRDDLDIEDVLIDRLAEDGLREILVQREGRSARQLRGGCVRAAPPG